MGIEEIVVFVICLCCFGAALIEINRRLVEAKEKNKNKNKENNENNEEFSNNIIDGQVNRNDNIRWHN